MEGSFGLPALTGSVYRLCLNFQKWLGESSHLFSCILSLVKRQGGKVVKHMYLACSLYDKIKLHGLHLVGLVLLDA